MAFSGRLCNGDHLHGKLGGALRQLSQHAFAIGLRVAVLALVRVFLALDQHRVDEPRASVWAVAVLALGVYVQAPSLIGAGVVHR